MMPNGWGNMIDASQDAFHNPRQVDGMQANDNGVGTPNEGNDNGLDIRPQPNYP